MAILLIVLLAETTDPSNLLEWLSRAGSLGLSLVFGWLFLTDRIVSGKTHARVLAERDRLYDVILEHSGITKKVVNLDIERLAVAEQLLKLQKEAE